MPSKIILLRECRNQNKLGINIIDGRRSWEENKKAQMDQLKYLELKVQNAINQFVVNLLMESLVFP